MDVIQPVLQKQLNIYVRVTDSHCILKFLTDFARTVLKMLLLIIGIDYVYLLAKFLLNRWTNFNEVFRKYASTAD